MRTLKGSLAKGKSYLTSLMVKRVGLAFDFLNEFVMPDPEEKEEDKGEEKGEGGEDGSDESDGEGEGGSASGSKSGSDKSMSTSEALGKILDELDEMTEEEQKISSLVVPVVIVNFVNSNDMREQVRRWGEEAEGIWNYVTSILASP